MGGGSVHPRRPPHKLRVDFLALEHSPCLADIAAIGCVIRDPTDLAANALAIARLAIQMQSYCEGCVAPDGSPVRMRIGVCVGPAIAGLLGESMLR